MSETQYIRTRTKSGKEEMIALPTGGVAPHNQAWSTITDTPTTLVGYGITDGSSIPYPGAGIALSSGAAWESSIPNNSANWNTAYTDRLKWNGGSTGLTAATGRTSLGGTTVGQNVFTLSNPSAISFLRMNADNSVSALSASDFKTALSLQNVTNESKSTMFTNANLTGITDISYIRLANKLYMNDDADNYFIGQYAVTGSAGLKIRWFGGIYLNTGYGSLKIEGDLTEFTKDTTPGDTTVLYNFKRNGGDSILSLLQNKNVIIGGTSGSQLLTVHGEIGIRYGNNIVHYDVSEAHYWLQVPHSTNEYYWSYDGTMKMKLVSDGTLYCKGDVIAAYTP